MGSYLRPEVDGDRVGSPCSAWRGGGGLGQTGRTVPKLPSDLGGGDGLFNELFPDNEDDSSYAESNDDVDWDSIDSE